MTLPAWTNLPMHPARGEQDPLWLSAQEQAGLLPLDVAIAARVFDAAIARLPPRTGRSVWAQVDAGGVLYPIPPYSSRLEDAVKVLDALQAKLVYVKLYYNSGRTWEEPEWTLQVGGSTMIRTFTPVLPISICRLALELVGNPRYDGYRAHRPAR